MKSKIFEILQKACKEGDGRDSSLYKYISTDEGVAALSEKDDQGRTPLHFALTYKTGNIQEVIPKEALEILNSKNGKHLAISIIESERLTDFQYFFVLRWAMQKNHEKVIKKVIEICPNLLSSPDLLMLALSVGNKEVENSAIKAHPGLLLDRDVFLQAVVCGKADLVRKMLEDAQVRKLLSVVDAHGYTPLRSAEFFGHTGVAQVIRSHEPFSLKQKLLLTAAFVICFAIACKLIPSKALFNYISPFDGMAK